jgi:hypothetical protein
MSDPGRAWRAGDDPRELSHLLNAAHDRFLSTGRSWGVRPLIVKSWKRCVRSGLDPEQSIAPVDLVDDALEIWRSSHPLSSVMAIIRRLLVEDATEAGLLVAVSDAAGRLLWVEGDRGLRTRAERMHFVEGALWSEDQAGTNAPGTSLALDQPVQIFAAEHLARRATAWSCSAAPIHDPDTGAVLGALDLTGGDDVAAPHALSLIRATVAAVEGELRLQRLLLRTSSAPTASGSSRLADTVLHTLGRSVGVLQRPGGSSRLSLRHSEMLTLLAANPDGLSGDELGVALHGHELASVTLRAELSRLRPLLAPLVLESRPYRLRDRLPTDGAEVRRLLATGDVGGAVALYGGPILPKSESPGVVRLREELHEHLRATLLQVGDADALLRFADTDHGRLDWEIWHAAWSALPASSSRGEQVLAHLAYLDRELGALPVPSRRPAALGARPRR